MSEQKSLFREKSLEQFSSSEQLNDYIRVANPSVFIVLGAVIAFLIGSCPFLLVGLSLIIVEGGDIMLVLNLIRFRTDAKEILIYDHPTEAGSIMFTR